MSRSLSFAESGRCFADAVRIAIGSVRDVLPKGVLSYAMLVFAFTVLGLLLMLITQNAVVWSGFSLIWYLAVSLFLIGVVDIACRREKGENIAIKDFFVIFARFDLWLRYFVIWLIQVALSLALALVVALVVYVFSQFELKPKAYAVAFVLVGIVSLFVLAALAVYYLLTVANIYALFLAAPNGQNMGAMQAVKEAVVAAAKNVRAVVVLALGTVGLTIGMAVVSFIISLIPMAAGAIIAGSSRHSPAFAASSAWAVIIFAVFGFVVIWTTVLYFGISGRRIFEIETPIKIKREPGSELDEADATAGMSVAGATEGMSDAGSSESSVTDGAEAISDNPQVSVTGSASGTSEGSASQENG